MTAPGPHDSIQYLHWPSINYRRSRQSGAVRSGIRRTRNIIWVKISKQTNICGNISVFVTVFSCSTQMCRLVTKQRLSDFQMTCLSSQSLLNSNVSWHCFATIQNIFAKFKKFIKELFSVMQSIHVKFLFSINYFLCISYFVTVLENNRASHNFSSLCHLLSSIMSRGKYSVFGKYLYCANVKIFRSGITPGLGPDTHPPAINIYEVKLIYFIHSDF